MPDFKEFEKALHSDTKSKESALDDNGQLKERHIINGVPNVVSKTFEQSYTSSPDKIQSLLDEGINVTINRTNIDELEEERNIHKALEQGALSKIFNSLEQLVVDEVVLGTLKGFGDIFDATLGRLIEEDKSNDYSSGYTRFFEDLQERNRNAFPIYRKNPYKPLDFGDVGWYAQGFTSVGSTLSLLLPARGIAGGIGKLGKLVKAEGWASRGLKGLKNTNWGLKAIEKEGAFGKVLSHANYYGNKVNEFSNVASTAILSRIAENYQEARGLYQDGYKKIKSNLEEMSKDDKEEFFVRNPNFVGLSDDEIAQQLASDAATDVFWTDMPLVLMDFLQYKGVESFLKGGGKQLTSASLERTQKKLLAKLSGNDALEKALDLQSKGFFKKSAIQLGDKLKTGIKHPLRTFEGLELSEGFEEGWQAIATESAQDYIDYVLDKHHNRRSLGSYLMDGETWDQAFWGALGGIVFQRGAQGFGKLKRKFDAKQALKKGDIIQEQYIEFVKTNGKEREVEIEGREKKFNELVDNLRLIDANLNPLIRDEKTNKFAEIKTPEEKAKIQNEVVNEWVTEFTLSAVDAGNMQLLSDFVASPEFKKYTEDKLKNYSILDKKSLESRVEDVYKLYSKNLSSVIENTSANDYGSVRKLARYITRKELSIASAENEIEQMRIALSQLTDYIPDTNYEQFRKFDIVLDQLKKLNKIDDELDAARKDHKISKSGYEIEKERVGFAKDIIKKQLKSLNISEDLNESIDEENLKAINATIKNIKTDKNIKEEGKDLPNQVKKGIDAIIYKELEQQIDVLDLPRTQEDFEDLYNAVHLDSITYFNARVNKAIERVKNYLVESDDLDKAINSAMDETFEDISNPVRRALLKESMDILKIGSHSHAEIQKIFNEEVDSIRKERESNKTKSETVVEDGKEVKNPVDLNDKKVVEVDKSDDSSKGDKEKTNTPIKEEEQLEDIDTPPEINDLLKQEKEEFKKEQEDVNKGDISSLNATAQGFIDRFNNPSETEIKNEFSGAFKILAKKKPEVVSKMIEDGINSEAYNTFLNDAITLLTASGIYTYNEVAEIAQYQLKIYLHSVVGANKVSPKIKDGIFKLINQIDSISTREKLNEQFSVVETISDDQFKANMEKFLKDYFGLGDKVSFETQNGKKVINLDTLFEDLLKLSEEGVYNFEELAEIVNNIYNYALNYSGTEFKFVSSDIFDETGMFGDVIEKGSFDSSNTTAAKINNLTTVINKLYNQQINPNSVVDDNMHFDISNTIKNQDLTYLKDKELKIEYKYVGGVKTVSLYYINEGKHVEIGYLGVVKRSKDNKTLSLENKTGIITSVTKNNEEYHTTTKEIEDILYKLADLIDESDVESDYKYFADMLWSQFAYNKTVNPDYQLTEKQIDALIKNEAFRHFLDLVDLKLPIGETYTREDGSTGRKKVKIDSGNIDNLPNKVANVSSLLRQINNVLFYDYKFRSTIETKSDVLRGGIRRYIEKAYKNYSQTLSYQKALNDKKSDSIKLEFVAADNSYLNFDKSVRRDVSALGIKGNIEAHPFIYLTKDGVMQAEGWDKPFANKAGFRSGTSGILLDVRAGNPMIAFLRDAKNLSENKELVGAINKEYQNIVKEYIGSSGTNVLDAYNKALSFFNNLFGNSYSLFDGYRIAQTNGSFTIFKKDKQNNVIPVMTFYKYGATFDKASGSWIVDGKKISNDELVKYYRPTIDIHQGDVTKRIKSLNNKESSNIITKTFDTVIKDLTYSRNAVTIDPKRNNGFITKSNGTEFDLKIGDYVQHYKSYSDYIVKNNAFATTHMGDRKSNVMKANADTASSVFVKYTGAREYLSEEEKIAQQGFAANLSQLGINEGDSMNPEQVLEASGFSKEEVAINQKLFKALKVGPVTISFERKIEGNEEIYAGYKNGKVTFYSKAIFAIGANKEHAPRLLIHEYVHKIIDDEKFFTSTEYGPARTKAILDTWTQFYEKSKDNPQLKDFITGFLNATSSIKVGDKNLTYAELLKSDVYEHKAYVANEWVAEVLSNKNLADYLNKVPYEGNLIINKESKKQSILQRIIKLIAELFTDFGKTKSGTLLDQLYISTGDISVVETIKDAIDSSTLTIPEENPSTSDEENNDDDTFYTRREAAAWFNDSTDDIGMISDADEDIVTNDEDLDDIEGFSSIEGLPQEIRMTDYINDTKNNPYGLQLVSDMDSWLQSIPYHERAAMASNLNSGALEYLCQ